MYEVHLAITEDIKSAHKLRNFRKFRVATAQGKQGI